MAAQSNSPGTEQVESRVSLETLQPPHAENVEPSQLLSDSFSMSVCRPGFCAGLLAWDPRKDEPVYSL